MLKYYSLTVIVCIATVGCSKTEIQRESDRDSTESMASDHSPSSLKANQHPDHGPHGGELIELGKEDFHIEMTHAGGATQMYVLDSTATQAFAIEAISVKVSLKLDGEVTPFDVPADPQPEDEAGKASRFVSDDAQLSRSLESEAEGAVVVVIDGKSYTGQLHHSHSHDHHP